MVIHKSVKCGSIGAIDKYGYGSSSLVRSWPTLFGDATFVMMSSVGSVQGPFHLSQFRRRDGTSRYEYTPCAAEFDWAGDFYFVGEDGRAFIRLADFTIVEFPAVSDAVAHLKKMYSN